MEPLFKYPLTATEGAFFDCFSFIISLHERVIIDLLCGLEIRINFNNSSNFLKYARRYFLHRSLLFRCFSMFQVKIRWNDLRSYGCEQ